MNTQLNKTIKSISPILPQFIYKEEAIFKALADVRIEKIDSRLLLNHGTIQEIITPIHSQSLYISIYYALFDAELIHIPHEFKIDSNVIDKGISIFDFLAGKRNLDKLKAIIHLDIFEKSPCETESKLQWLKIQIATPKQNKPIASLVQEEIERRESLKEATQ